MELSKKNIHMTKISCKSSLQITLDEDFNVPDVKPDLEQVIKLQGQVVVKESKLNHGKLTINGRLKFNLLYLGNDSARPIHNIRGELPFEELINMDEACPEDHLTVHANIEDLSASVIHSRKINVRSLISLEFTAKTLYDEDAAFDVKDGENICTKNKTLNITQLAYSGKDSLRVREELRIPAGKPQIGEIIYEEAQQGEMDLRILEGKLHIKGDIQVCILYLSDEDGSLQCLEKNFGYREELGLNGISDEMVPQIISNLAGQETNIRSDEDGEIRLIDWEGVLNLEIRVYEENELDILEDVYSTKCEIKPELKTAYLSRMRLKNNSKLRIDDQLEISVPSQGVQQILLPQAVVKIDDLSPTDNGIQIEGVVEIKALYLSGSPDNPLGAVSGILPFSHRIEVSGMENDDLFEVHPQAVQVSLMIIQPQQLDVKAVIDFDTIVFKQINCQVITELKQEPRSMEDIRRQPGMIGYIVSDNEDLWQIAKRFYTTIDQICRLNGLEKEEVKAGDRILILKTVDAAS